MMLPACGCARPQASAAGPSWKEPSGAGLAARGPAATAAALAAVRSALDRLVIAVTFDANDRENDDGRRLRRHADHPAVPRTAPMLGKFNHSPHTSPPTGPSWPAQSDLLIRDLARLTVR